MENTPENIDKVMTRIRREAARLNPTGPAGTDDGPLPNCPDIDLPDVGSGPGFAAKDRYMVTELLNFHDREFIDIAYRAVLNRLPDTGGFNSFLKQLQSGHLSKIEIIGRLRYSPEGRRKNTAISGLLLPFIIQSACKIPVIGYVLRILTGLFNLPAILANIQKTENTGFALHREIRQKSQHTARQLKSLRDHTAALQNRSGNDFARIQKQIDSLDHRIDVIEKTVQLKDNPGLDAFYADFEDTFRGTRADIKDRLKIYLPYVAESIRETAGGTILDLGAGNGEWLELLKEQGYRAVGVERNQTFIARAEKAGLNFIHGDIIDYLKTLPDGCLSAVTGFHILEHLNFYSVMTLIDETLRVLKPGGRTIFETPNPENLTVGACSFYSDPTHNRPLVPDTVRFLLSHRGFHAVEILRLHKYSDFFKVTSTDDTSRKWLHNEMDFSIIGQKK